MPIFDTQGLRVPLPDSWTVFADGNQQVAQGPEDEEVILTRSTITGSPATDARRRIIDAMKSRVLESIRLTAANPELVSDEPVEQIFANGNSVVRCSSRSTDGYIRFDQFGVVLSDQVLLLTWESPVAVESNLKHFQEAIDLVARV